MLLLTPPEAESGKYELPAEAILSYLRERNGAAVDPAQLNAGLPLVARELLKPGGWYEEAGLISYQNFDGKSSLTFSDWQPFTGEDLASQMQQRFLRTLKDRVAIKPASGLEAVEQPLPTCPNLDERIAQLGKTLLIDAKVIKRIYSSLIAGRHVVLSGPPGTGKTELAKLLPNLLWAEKASDINELSFDPEQPPVVVTPQERHGYKVNLVTATEDWSVRDVVGGIGPRLDKPGGALQYVIEYGHLTRTLLQNYSGTEDGKSLGTNPSQFQRVEYVETKPGNNEMRRYRGVWLVIDEFTRAPVDAAFGSLLTMLGGGEASLSVPTGTGEIGVPVPADFRIIGTLNSFDRHFLNQISEAIKRRFNFIDVMPPAPHYADYEQGLAVNKALARLHPHVIPAIVKDTANANETFSWPAKIAVTLTLDANIERPVIDWGNSQEATPALRSFWRIFQVIRIFRQLGTAQAEAVYTNLLTNYSVLKDWLESLDSALADTLADQLQVLGRDAQRILLAYLKYAQDTAAFANELNKNILAKMPSNRRAALLHLLNEADGLRNQEAATTEPISTAEKGILSEAQVERLFDTGEPLALPLFSRSIFYARLNSLANERGL